MTETVSETQTPVDKEIPVFPMARECPLDPPPTLARIQSECPVSHVRIWNASTPWIITRYDDVKAVLSDPGLSVNTQLPGYPAFNAGNQAKQKRVKTFINMDDPEHLTHRRIAQPSFLIKKMEAMRPRIQEIVDGQIDVLLAQPQPADFVKHFALPVPSIVICELLGVPYDDREFFQDVSTALLARTSEPQVILDATERMLGYLVELIESKTNDPGEGLLGRVITTQMRDGNVTREEVAALADLVLTAGHETTANMIALSTLMLLQRPEQADELRRSIPGSDPVTPASYDDDLMANAVEELLRYLTITHFGRRRVAVDDVYVGGQTIHKGDGVIVANDIANRDPAVFPEPNKFDIHRPHARRQLAFGYGAHQCLGQQMARIELHVALSSVLRRIPTLQSAVPLDELPFKHDGVVYGLHEFPVTW